MILSIEVPFFFIISLKMNLASVLASAVHILKLERYRED